MRFALIANRTTPTNRQLSCALIGDARWEEMTLQTALETLRAGDGALGRLDVLATLDGVDDGLWALGALAAPRRTTSCRPLACSTDTASPIRRRFTSATGGVLRPSSARWS